MPLRARTQLQVPGWLLFASLLLLGRAQRLGLQEAVIHSVYNFFLMRLFPLSVSPSASRGSAWNHAKSMSAICVLLGMIRSLAHTMVQCIA